MLSYELREHVLDYINNRIDFEALEDWYVPRLRQFLNDPNSADADVIATIELASVHLAEGLISESEARDMLRDALIEADHESIHLEWIEPSMHGSDVEINTSTRASASNSIESRTLNLSFMRLSIIHS